MYALSYSVIEDKSYVISLLGDKPVSPSLSILSNVFLLKMVFSSLNRILTNVIGVKIFYVNTPQADPGLDYGLHG
jgi:hypothetical protein